MSMTPEQWRAAYPEAAAALRSVTVHIDPTVAPVGSEKRVENDIVLAAARAGGQLWRNNKGAGKIGDAFIRWGLANRTKQESDTWASADLIGIYPLLITPEHVGTVVGQFYSVEVKKPGGRIAQAQENWAALVTARGGRAIITDSVEGLL